MKTQEVIQGLLEYARPEILKEYRADSCIVSTAVGLDILTSFGILAEPLAVRTFLFNKAFADRIDAGSPWPRGDEVKRWTDEDGSYSVGIGFGDQQPNKWAGHLVILVERQFLLDLSIDQATRPKYDMFFEPFVVEVDDKFLQGEAPKVFGYNGCIIRIELLPNKQTGYITSPDWTFVGRRKKIIENTLRSIKAKNVRKPSS